MCYEDFLSGGEMDEDDLLSDSESESDFLVDELEK